MKVNPQGFLLDELTRNGHVSLKNGFEVDEKRVSQLVSECQESHPGYTEEQRRDWAIYHAIAENAPRAQKKPGLSFPTIQIFKDTESGWVWAWRIAVLAMLFLIAGMRS